MEEVYPISLVNDPFDIVVASRPPLPDASPYSGGVSFLILYSVLYSIYDKGF